MGVTMNTDERLLNQIKKVLSYNPDTGLFHWKVNIRRKFDFILAGTQAGSTNKAGRVIIWFKGKGYLAHRLAWFMSFGNFPEQLIDHIDGDPLNNKLSNLRDVSSNLNNQNRKSPRVGSSSKYLGVSWNKQKQRFVARISAEGKQIYLGSFDIEEQARDAYLVAKRQLHEGCTI